MNSDPDTTRIVRSWLDDGMTQLPDRVLDAVLDQVPSTPQRGRTWWPARRHPAVNYSIGIAVAAAVLVAVAIIGSQLVGSPTDVGGPGVEPTPAPEASVAAPSATQSPGHTDGTLPEGSHVLWDGPSTTVTVTIPAPGWYGEPGGGIVESGNPDENFGPDDAGIIGPFVGNIHVPADPCQWSTTMPATPATTVDAVVAALQAQASRDASAPADIIVDGHVGQSITVRVPDDAVFGECDHGGGEARFCTLTEGDPRICHRFNQFPGQIDEVWILDVNGEVMVFDAGYGDETPSEDVAELRAILESIALEGS